MRYIVLLLCMLLVPVAASAFVTSVSVNPNTREVSVSGPAMATVTWQVDVNSNNIPST